MTKDIKINTVSLADLRADHEGILSEQISRLIKDVFSEPPWNENFSISRLQFGLGVEMMRKNPLLLVAQANNLDNPIVGYLLGQELVKHSADSRDQTLFKIAGSKDLDYLANNGKRIFYVSGIGVLPGYRRCGIAEQLSMALINELRRQGFGYRIGRTDTTVHAMRSLYLKQGFQELPVFDANYPGRTYWLLQL